MDRSQFLTCCWCFEISGSVNWKQADPFSQDSDYSWLSTWPTCVCFPVDATQHRLCGSFPKPFQYNLVVGECVRSLFFFVKPVQRFNKACSIYRHLISAKGRKGQIVHPVFRYYQGVTSVFTGIDEDDRGCFCVILDISRGIWCPQERTKSRYRSNILEHLAIGICIILTLHPSGVFRHD